MVTAYKAQYENLIAEQRTRISELSNENSILQSQLDEFKQKEKLIISTLERAEKSADEIIEQAKEQYLQEMQRLKAFVENWNDYFDDLKEKYPLYSNVKKALKIRDRVKDFNGGDVKVAITELDESIDKYKIKFNPKQKIKDYIASTGDNGFNLDEVLNPGKLELEEICKELGLIEQSE